MSGVIRVAAGGMLAVMAMACGGSKNTPTAPSTPASPSLSAITLTGYSGTPLNRRDQTVQLTATARYSDGATRDVTATAAWRSDNAAVATVSGSGLVTAVGDGEATVVAELQGVAGTVRETGLFMTELTTADGVCMRVPNGKIWGSAIMNYSENPTRRMDMEVTVTFDSPIQAGLDALAAMLDSEKRLLAEPRREVMVVRYTDRGVTLNARYWTSNDDFWAVQFALFARLKSTVENAGCRIAVPVRDVHMPAIDAADADPRDDGDGDARGRADGYRIRSSGPGRPN